MSKKPMNQNARLALAVILGVALGNLLFFLVGFIANSIQPTPAEFMDPSTPEIMAKRVQSTSLFKWLATLLGHGLGALAAGFIASKLARQAPTWMISLITLLFALWAFYLFYFVYPEVIWVPLVMFAFALFFPGFGAGLANPKPLKS
ncbi:MAG: hypothetical protein HKN16_06080 [Saprospiraceae bacterium]|nr:hypothetical protein [Saprospiraceae bacterium]